MAISKRIICSVYSLIFILWITSDQSYGQAESIVAENTCQYTFIVQAASVERGGPCPYAPQVQDGHAQNILADDDNPGNLHPPINVTAINEEIIRVESRMIERDAFTRMELRQLQKKFIKEGNERNSLRRRVTMGDLKTKYDNMDSDMHTLHTSMLDLRKRLRKLESRAKGLRRIQEPGRLAELRLKSSCRHGDGEYNKTCYTYIREKHTWVKAQENCQELGGHLVAIETNEEQKFVQKFLKSKKASRDALWVYAGGNDRNNDKEWTWIGTNHVIRDSSNWYSVVTPPPDEGFVCMFLFIGDMDNLGKWTKDKCNFEMPSVCEIPLLDKNAINVI